MANKKLVKKLDRIFSEFIRLRDSDGDFFKCCSCGQIKPYAQADAGHFINRRFMATRWREDNCHAQCRYCNRFQEGAGSEYTLFMIDKYGRDKVEFLNSIKHETMKYTDGDLELLIDDFKQKRDTLRS